MIQLAVEPYDDGAIMWLDDESQAYLGAAVDDLLIFVDGAVTVQSASGDIGQTFSYVIKRPVADTDSDDSAL